VRPSVNAIPEQGIALLRQVDADLVGATRLEPAFDERGRPQRLQHTHVRDGVATERRIVGAAAPAVTAILNQA
jgi:hypothetical protein